MFNSKKNKQKKLEDALIRENRDLIIYRNGYKGLKGNSYWTHELEEKYPVGKE